MSKLGLALGGGGARGFAHIGVLKVLDEENISINSIAGCSMGAIIGGLYAYFGNALQVEEFIYNAVKDSRFEKLGMDAFVENKKSLDKNYFEQFFGYIENRFNAIKALRSLSYFDEEITAEIYKMIPEARIEDLKVNFSAIATDLKSGEEINFTKGSLRDAIRASSAVPGIYPPVRIDDYLLVDGSASESVPVGKVRETGADRVLAVDVIKNIKVVKKTKNMLDILYRTEDITSYHLSLIRLKEADLVISPRVKKLSWADFDKAEEIIQCGEKAARENLDKIKKLVNRNTYLLEIEQYIKKLKGFD